uniref:Uncharacterized protein n=1 Tax=Babesia bovis TaxID=5865 RepID=S6BP37_BABBO|nr:hypothetical protein [Babesia bovis]
MYSPGFSSIGPSVILDCEVEPWNDNSGSVCLIASNRIFEPARRRGSSMFKTRAKIAIVCNERSNHDNIRSV